MSLACVVLVQATALEETTVDVIPEKALIVLVGGTGVIQLGVGVKKRTPWCWQLRPPQGTKAYVVNAIQCAIFGDGSNITSFRQDEHNALYSPTTGAHSAQIVVHGKTVGRHRAQIVVHGGMGSEEELAIDYEITVVKANDVMLDAFTYVLFGANLMTLLVTSLNSKTKEIKAMLRRPRALLVSASFQIFLLPMVSDRDRAQCHIVSPSGGE